jgi:hypothetical protein
MVRALLAGQKTQTRRVVKAPIDYVGPGGDKSPSWNDPSCWGWETPDAEWMKLKPEQGEYQIACPYGAPGDRLWVKENCWIAPPDFGDEPADSPRDYEGRPRIVGYSATMDGDSVRAAKGYGVRQSPSIHMPRWASRLTLEVTAVRAERLQAITEEEAAAEGVTSALAAGMLHGGSASMEGCARVGFPDAPRNSGDWAARDCFRLVWGAINGADSWVANPWCWAVSFKAVPRG